MTNNDIENATVGNVGKIAGSKASRILKKAMINNAIKQQSVTFA